MKFLHELGIMRQHTFDMLIFFVTGRCNAKCQHCFYWRNLGPTHAGPSLEDVTKLASSMPPFRTLLLSGGEPSLRRDLVQVVDAFRRSNHVQNVSIPTNGLLPGRIADMAGAIAALDSGLYVTINLSIDGFEETHDRIRGVQGNFQSSLLTINKLRELSVRHPNLRIFVNTVICADNLDEIVEFAEYARSNRLTDGHFFEIIRGEPPDVRIKAVPPEKLREIYRALLPIQEHYVRREARHKRKGVMGIWRQVTDMGNLVNRYRHQWAVHSIGAKWDYPCMAGEAIAVVDYDGRLRICELREESVELAAFDFDFPKAWQSATLRGEAAVAKTHVCDCTHTCFLGISMRQDFRARFVKAPWLYLRYKIGGLW
jgi:MoaA/NifB/PqqE/SkfB family radical SAM enzyme